ncbi:hypothetical protein COY52_05795 [Candidatus Desantisbacteria bacterium CG_4_10_14_0_8_um_filter_48_22]|uniref:BrnT family toxin n=1 Tax=Candidatus Desantisbacteria bacterium CG_4_10_14_0_8_um_filter_48_22 TaxID=1974543 RepID=A0A2M7SBM2_9BACT|nr:MAG: hypothetical protein AUJ67_07990 [Candidatus Desantisbacteria bacterium CG1_02_49_89]PIV55124.1 MAG: hypothetical protein COS16_08235 [Candidatus Desantisbacteria bacterium CG02_land_8_20_14_3_00_49_13]PIZ16884.1 MAG: hypothetical protein COY52_05795 [Candidatus Desantisbacteria bacterium CG_4_10_14_0_8_um_filter_48_22]
MKLIPEPVNFDWDKGNLAKNWDKHRVTNLECEEIFYNDPLVVKARIEGYTEERFYAIGKTGRDRFLFVVFIVRAGKVRIISARDANKKEKVIYNEKGR